MKATIYDEEFNKINFLEIGMQYAEYEKCTFDSCQL